MFSSVPLLGNIVQFFLKIYTVFESMCGGSLGRISFALQLINLTYNDLIQVHFATSAAKP